MKNYVSKRLRRKQKYAHVQVDRWSTMGTEMSQRKSDEKKKSMVVKVQKYKVKNSDISKTQKANNASSN